MYNLQCTNCGAVYLENKDLYQCLHCRSSLFVDYDYDKIGQKIREEGFSAQRTGLWKYRELLPVPAEAEVVTLHEGGTPLHRCDRLAETLKLDTLYVKDETGNPTGTYKDRPASVAVSVAKLMGATIAAIASDGNAAPSVAAYAAKAGLECFTFMPASTPRERLIQVQMYGAPVITIEGSVNKCIDLVEKGRGIHGWHHMSTAGPINPYQREASKTIAFEICEQLDWQIPDWVAAPVGGGGLVAAVWQGFVELKTLGLISKLPRILAAQACGCAPLVRAFEAGDSPREIRSWEKPRTIATTIEVPFPLDGDLALQAVLDSGGMAISVTDDEILTMTRKLASLEGILVEPTAAASMAAVAKGKEKNQVDGVIVNIATGTGLKTLSLFASLWNLGAQHDSIPAGSSLNTAGMAKDVFAWAKSQDPSAAIICP